MEKEEKKVQEEEKQKFPVSRCGQCICNCKFLPPTANLTETTKRYDTYAILLAICAVIAVQILDAVTIPSSKVFGECFFLNMSYS